MAPSLIKHEVCFITSSPGLRLLFPHNVTERYSFFAEVAFSSNAAQQRHQLKESPIIRDKDFGHLVWKLKLSILTVSIIQ